MEFIEYLGVVIDQHLNWNAHIDYVIKKNYHMQPEFYLFRHYVSKQTLIKLYYSFAYSFIKHGIILWDRTCQTSLEKIKLVQNNIICIMNQIC